MNAAELYDWIGNNTTDDDEIDLEVGGDGAVHSGPVRHIRRDGNRIVISSEEQ